MALTDSLIAYWKLEETSGTRVDEVGNNDLTDVNTVGSSSAGKIDVAAAFAAASSERLTIADNTDLSTGDIDFTFSGWIFLTSKAAVRPLVSKMKTSTNDREYRIIYNNSSDRFTFTVNPNGQNGSNVTVTANNLGSPALSTWYFIVAWHDSVANTINIQVNNGTADSAAHTTGVFNGAADFQIGASSEESFFHDGRIDEVAFWKRILTSDEKTELYNSGNGSQYPFTITTITNEIKPAGGGDFSSLSAWEAARQGNIAGRNTIERALCFGGNLGTVVINGWTTDSSRYVIVEADTSAKHLGIKSTAAGVAHIDGGTGTPIEVRASHTKIRDLSITATGAGGNNITMVTVTGVVIERCILSDKTNCVDVSGTSNTGNVLRNCIIHGADIGIQANGASAAITVHNCTIRAGNAGGGAFKVINSGTITEQNNYISVTSGNVYNQTAGTFNKGANTATSNNEATTVGLRSIPYSTANFINVTEGSENLHIVSSSVLKDAAADLSGSDVIVDIDGNVRVGSFDIGADELSGSFALFLIGGF